MKKPTNFACVRPKAGWSLIKSVLSARSLYLSPCGRGRIASLDAIRMRGCDLSLGRNPLYLPIEQNVRWKRLSDLAGGPRPKRAAKSPDTPLATTVGEPGIFAVVTHDRTVG